MTTEELQKKLLSTTDASVWAEEFCRLFVVGRKTSEVSDPFKDPVGLMIGWFANAIEVGRSARAVALEEEIKRVEKKLE